MGTSYASKSVEQNGARHTKRYWYYVSKIGDADQETKAQRLPAVEVEDVVYEAVRDQLTDQPWLANALRTRTDGNALISQVLDGLDRLRVAKTRDADLERLIQRIDLMPDAMRITLDLKSIVPASALEESLTINFEVPFTLHQKGRAKPIVIMTNNATSRPDAELIGLVADAKRWMSDLLNGYAASVQDITDREYQQSGAVSRILPLAFLAHDIAIAILKGHQPALLSAKTLRDLKALPLDWAEQRRVLGFQSI